jgi:hypothetical protein
MGDCSQHISDNTRRGAGKPALPAENEGAVLNPLYAKQVNTGNGIFFPTIVVDGQIVSTWKRTLKKSTVVITPSPFSRDSTKLKPAPSLQPRAAMGIFLTDQ